MPHMASDLDRVRRSFLGFVDPRQLMLDAGRQPDPWQERLLMSTSRRVLILCSRQIGKSESVGAKAAHEAVFRPPAVVGITSDSQSHSKVLLTKAREYVRQMDGGVIQIVDESTERINLSNGSYMVALPGTRKAVRSHSLTLAIVDEAAFTTDELYRSFLPTIDATQGSLYALTSAGIQPSGWFWRLYTQNGRYSERDSAQIVDEWDRYLVPASECPRVFTAEALERKRAEDELGFEREYQCRFGGGTLGMERNPLVLPDLSGLILEEFV